MFDGTCSFPNSETISVNRTYTPNCLLPLTPLFWTVSQVQAQLPKPFIMLIKKMGEIGILYLLKWRNLQKVLLLKELRRVIHGYGKNKKAD